MGGLWVFSVFCGRVLFSGTVSLGFQFRAETHLIDTQAQVHIPFVAYCKDEHASYLHIATFSPHAQSLLLTHSCTQWEAACALSFSQCLGGHSNYCGSWATERQPSVWLIGISGQSRTQHNLRTQHTTVSSLIQNTFWNYCKLVFPLWTLRFSYWRFCYSRLTLSIQNVIESCARKAVLIIIFALAHLCEFGIWILYVY